MNKVSQTHMFNCDNVAGGSFNGLVNDSKTAAYAFPLDNPLTLRVI
jgi:hypothetical protein